MNSDYILEMEHIEKDYSGNKVLKDINIRVEPGQIVSLVGENGAGKSTLMNILFGMPVIHETGGYGGTIRIDGAEVTIRSPMEAMSYGIGMVHQEFMLIDGYDVAENIKLNRENVEPTALRHLFGNRLNLLDQDAMHREARKTLDTLGIALNDRARVGSLPVGYKQFVEIARELDKERTNLIVLDEPTAVLTESEADQFMSCVRSVAQKGIAFIFISHRLNEVKDLSQHIYILRDGELVADHDASDLSTVKMSQLMVGREIAILNRESEEENDDDAPVALEMSHFAVSMPGDASGDISLQVKQGEIFGIGGLAGHGKSSIANGIMGLFPSRGKVQLHGEPLDVSSTAHTLDKKVAFVSEDRRGLGLMLDESILLNITVAAMKVHNRFIVKRLGIPFFDDRSARDFANQMIEDLDIRCTGYNQKVGSLSGGNQQKVCIARALALNPDILLISEPTRGIDIGAKKTVMDLLLRLNKEKGSTIIVTSSELAELRSICNRVALISSGRVAGILRPDDPDYKYGLLMSGLDESDQLVEEVS